MCQQHIIDTSCFPVSRDFCPELSRTSSGFRDGGPRDGPDRAQSITPDLFTAAVVMLAGRRELAVAAGVKKQTRLVNVKCVCVCVFAEGVSSMWSGRRQRADDTRLRVCVARSKAREMTQ